MARDEYPNVLELIITDVAADFAIYRVQVPGGWLVVVRDTAILGFQTTTFVSDPQWNWIIAP